MYLVEPDGTETEIDHIPDSNPFNMCYNDIGYENLCLFNGYLGGYIEHSIVTGSGYALKVKYTLRDGKNKEKIYGKGKGEWNEPCVNSEYLIPYTNARAQDLCPIYQTSPMTCREFCDYIRAGVPDKDKYPLYGICRSDLTPIHTEGDYIYSNIFTECLHLGRCIESYNINDCDSNQICTCYYSKTKK